MECNTSTVCEGKVGTLVEQKLITKAAAKQTYLLTRNLNLIQIESMTQSSCIYHADRLF